MKSLRSRIGSIAIVALLLMGCATLGAQTKGTLTVQCNVTGSQVYLDGRLVGNATPNFTFSCPLRAYTLKVSHAGYQDFTTTFTMTAAGVLIQANLIPVGQAAPAPAPTPTPAPAPTSGKFTLSVNCNVPNAGVLVNGAMVGKVPYSAQYPAGRYTIIVRWGGYQDYTETVNLTGNYTVNAVLQSSQPVTPPPPAQYPYSINANVPGATVAINGTVVGRTPYSGQLTAGSYTITVTAPGYGNFSQSVVVNGPGQVNAVLQPNQPAQYPYSINANVPGATVAINGTVVGRTPYSGQLTAGSYTITVTAPGYGNFSQSVVVNGPGQVNAVLSPLQASLSVNANVPGADVYINGSPVGKVPLTLQLNPGNYTVVVKAMGYGDYSQNVQVQPQGYGSGTQVNAVLSPLQASLSVNANVPGADVYLNGSPVGKVPLTLQLNPGNYTVVVKAMGYGDYSQNVQLQYQGQGTQVNAVLMAALSGWQVSIPDSIVNRDAKGGHWSQIMIYVDGQLQRSNSGQVGPGRHVIRIVCGGIASEVVVDIQPGRTYVFEPFFGITVK